MPKVVRAFVVLAATRAPKASSRVILCSSGVSCACSVLQLCLCFESESPFAARPCMPWFLMRQCVVTATARLNLEKVLRKGALSKSVPHTATVSGPFSTGGLSASTPEGT